MEDLKGLKTLDSLDYTSPREAIAEKFHMSEALLAALNPGKKFDEAGQTIAVMNVAVKESKSAVTRAEVDKTAPDGESPWKFRRTDCLLSRDCGKRGEAEPKRRPQGGLDQCKSVLLLQPGLQVQGNKIQTSLQDQARPQQPRRLAMDRTFRARIRHSRDFLQPIFSPRQSSMAVCGSPTGTLTGWQSS